MNAASDLTFGEQRKKALDLVEPGAAGRGQMHVPARPAVEPIADGRSLVGCVVVDDQMHIKIGWHGGLDLVEELAELDGAVAPLVRGFRCHIDLALSRVRLEGSRGQADRSPTEFASGVRPGA